MERVQSEEIVEKSSCNPAVPTVYRGRRVAGTEKAQLASGNCSRRLSVRAAYQRPQTGGT